MVILRDKKILLLNRSLLCFFIFQHIIYCSSGPNLFWSQYKAPQWIERKLLRNGLQCPEPTGQFSHPNFCDLYLNCWDGYPTTGRCYHGLVFNEKIKACDYKKNVNCGNRGNSNHPLIQPMPQNNQNIVTPRPAEISSTTKRPLNEKPSEVINFTEKNTPKSEAATVRPVAPFDPKIFIPSSLSKEYNQPKPSFGEIKPKPQLEPITARPQSQFRPKPQLEPNLAQNLGANKPIAEFKPKPQLELTDSNQNLGENKPVAEFKPKPQLEPGMVTSPDDNKPISQFRPKPQLEPGSAQNPEGNKPVAGFKPKPPLSPNPTTNATQFRPKPQLEPKPTESENMGQSNFKPKPPFSPGSTNQTNFKPKPTFTPRPTFSPVQVPSSTPVESFETKPSSTTHHPVIDDFSTGKPTEAPTAPSTPSTISNLKPKPPLEPDEEDEGGGGPPLIDLEAVKPKPILKPTEETTDVESPSSPKPPPLNPGNFKPNRPTGPPSQFPSPPPSNVDGEDDPNVLFPFLPSIPSKFKCPVQGGLLPVLNYCTSLIACIENVGHFLVCPQGMRFSPNLLKCVENTIEKGQECQEKNLKIGESERQKVVYAYLPMSKLQEIIQRENTEL